MCIPLSLGYKNLRPLSEELGVDIAWWRKGAPLYWPYVMHSIKSANKYEFLKADEKIEPPSLLYSVPEINASTDLDKLFEHQVRNGNVNFSYDEGNGKSSVKDYTKRILKFRETNKEAPVKFALSCNYLSIEQTRLDIGKDVEFSPNYEYLVVGGETFWSCVYGAMLWYEKLEAAGRVMDLIFMGMDDMSLLPVLAYIQNFWRGEVLFQYDPDFARGVRYSTLDGVRHKINYERREQVVLPCLCPFCTTVREKALRVPEFETIVKFHNLYATISQWLFIKWQAKNDQKEFRKTAKYKGILPYLDFIDSSVNWGWERAVKTLWWISGGGDVK